MAGHWELPFRERTYCTNRSETVRLWGNPLPPECCHRKLQNLPVLGLLNEQMVTKWGGGGVVFSCSARSF